MESCSSLTWVLISLLIFPSFNQPVAIQTQPRSDMHNTGQFPDTVHQWVNRLEKSLQTHSKYTIQIMIAGVLCFLAASISSAGGIGGGGLYLPILAILAGLDLKTASSFSAFMVTGGSMANVFCSLFIIKPKYPNKSLIDFNIALSSEPCMLLGVSAGVIFNRMFPEWLITVMFAIFLAWSTFNTFRSGIRCWKSESEARRNRNMAFDNGLPRDDGSDQSEELSTSTMPIQETHSNCYSERIPWIKLWTLVTIWLSFFLVYILRGKQDGQSIIQIKPCGLGYWIVSSTQIPLALVFTTWILHREERCRNQNLMLQEIQAENEGRPLNKLIFPVMALLAGILGGVFGIGGGMLISPLLLQIGVPPEVTAATCSFMVFFSSSMSSFQYLLLGMEHVTSAVIFATTCLLGSLLGLLVIQRAIRKHGRASPIIFSIGTVTALSAILLTISRASHVWKDFKAGRYMGFKYPC